jgi:hypothetical protein
MGGEQRTNEWEGGRNEKRGEQGSGEERGRDEIRETKEEGKREEKRGKNGGGGGTNEEL